MWLPSFLGGAFGFMFAIEKTKNVTLDNYLYYLRQARRTWGRGKNLKPMGKIWEPAGGPWSPPADPKKKESISYDSWRYEPNPKGAE